jgi:hypothetical protein
MYCAAGDFYIDPWRPVARAVITHAHADHARAGHAHYLASSEGERVLRARLGDITLQCCLTANVYILVTATVSLHPAGHVLGSAQVGSRSAAKCGWRPATTSSKPTPPAPPSSRCAPTPSSPNRPSACRSTAGRRRHVLLAELNDWWRANADAGRTSVVFAYAFGKSQRILAGLDHGIGPIVCHGAVEALNRAYRDSGVALPATSMVSDGLDGPPAPRAGDRAAVGAVLAVDEALRRLRRLLRLGLDAGARRAAPPRCRPRSGHVRPRRLARPAVGHRRDRCPAYRRHARPCASRWCAGSRNRGWRPVPSPPRSATRRSLLRKRPRRIFRKRAFVGFPASVAAGAPY